MEIRVLRGVGYTWLFPSCGPTWYDFYPTNAWPNTAIDVIAQPTRPKNVNLTHIHFFKTPNTYSKRVRVGHRRRRRCRRRPSSRGTHENRRLMFICHSGSDDQHFDRCTFGGVGGRTDANSTYSRFDVRRLPFIVFLFYSLFCHTAAYARHAAQRHVLLSRLFLNVSIICAMPRPEFTRSTGLAATAGLRQGNRCYNILVLPKRTAGPSTPCLVSRILVK